MPELTLEQAVEAVCSGLRGHAAASQEDPTNASAIVRQAEVLREAVRKYEEALSVTTGWSSPLRHLDDAEETTPSAEIAEAGSPDFSNSQWILVNARYYLRVDDGDALRDYVSERLQIDAPNQVAAVRALYEADGWNPRGYSSGLIAVDDSAIDVWVEEEGA